MRKKRASKPVVCVMTQKQNRPCGRVKRRCPIFPWGCPQSIVRAEELNFRVRDGNGCTLFAIITGSPAHTDGSLDTVYITTSRRCCQYPKRQIFPCSQKFPTFVMRVKSNLMKEH